VFLGVALGFGLTVLTMAYAVGHISGRPFQRGRVLYVIASGKLCWVPGGFASNGYGDLNPGKYGLAACLLAELFATFFFLFGLPEFRSDFA